MAFQLPEALRTPDDSIALDLLQRYYGNPYRSKGSERSNISIHGCLRTSPADSLPAICMPEACYR